MLEIEDNHLKLFENFNLENTRDRLIKIAMEMFAESGYDKTSIRELAKRADANIAAINYHFGGKEGLYHAVLEYIAEYMDSWAMPLINEYHKFVEEQNENFDIEKTIIWVGKFINTFMTSAFESYESNILLHKIIAREQLKPTLGFDKIYGLASIKLAEHIISDLLSKLTNKKSNDEEIIIYTISIVGQMETFISANSSIRKELNVEELTQTHIDTIKRVVKNQIECTILKLTK